MRRAPLPSRIRVTKWLAAASRLASIGLLVAVPVHAQMAAAPVPDLQAARQAFTARHYDQAAALAAAVASAAPDPSLRTRALLLQARALVNQEDFAHAEPVLRELEREAAPPASALYLLGYVLERRNQPRDSLAVFTRAAALAPPQPDDLKLVALDYVLLEDYPDAIHWLTRSVAADPANEEAWYYLGRSHMQVGDFVLAESELRKALALNDHDARPLDNLGLALEAQNRPEEAASAYRQAISAQQASGRRSEQPLLNLATLLNNQNRSSDALPLLKQAVALAPASVRCLEELSRAYTALGQPREGIAAMERAVAVDPENPRLHYRLAQLYRRVGESARADSEARISTRLYSSHSTDHVQ